MGYDSLYENGFKMGTTAPLIKQIYMGYDSHVGPLLDTAVRCRALKPIHRAVLCCTALPWCTTTALVSTAALDRGGSSAPFDDDGHSLAATDAGRADPVPFSGPDELVSQVAHDAAARSSSRVAAR
jgi:hypothetical protein